MKIAIVVSHPIQYFAPLFRELAKNVDLTVYYSWDFGVQATHDPEFGANVQWDIPVLEGYRHVFLKNIALQPSSSKPWGEINPGIVGAIRNGKYDAVVVVGWNFVTSWLAFLACIASGTPFLIRGESPLSQELQKPGWKLAVKRSVLRPLFRRAAGLLYIGEENRKFYLHYGVPAAKLFFTPYAVDNDRFLQGAEALRPRRSELRSKHGIADDATVIATVGKLIGKKRPMDLLRAYEVLLARHGAANTALLFVGDGALRKEVEGYAKARNIPGVIVTGFQNQLALPEFYAIADMFALPSGAGETWGLVVNEAMCNSLPVIASSSVGCGPDLVRDGENGFIVPVGDVEALARALHELWGNAAERRLFGAASRAIIAQYSFEEDIRGIFAACEDARRSEQHA